MESTAIEEKKAAWLSSGQVWLSTGEIARHYGKTPKAVYLWMKKGLQAPAGRVRLQSRWIGGELKSTPEWCEEFMAVLNAGGPAVAEPVRAVDAQARREQQEAARVLGNRTGKRRL